MKKLQKLLKLECSLMEGWQSLVYRGGLENRCGVKPTGGSNPLPSVVLPIAKNHQPEMEMVFRYIQEENNGLW